MRQFILEKQTAVALYERAWIEMPRKVTTTLGSSLVALYERAWIEMPDMEQSTERKLLSLSTRERGLKFDEWFPYHKRNKGRSLRESVD